jgi:TRAP-type C4-dicarboxylate transport system permease small subunit
MIRLINGKMLIAANYMLGVLTIAVALDVIMRYVFNSPLTGVKQFAEYALVWFCFLSVGWVLIEKKHVAITYLEQRMFSKSRIIERSFSVFIDLMCLCYTLPLLWLSGKTVWIEFCVRSVISGETGGFPTFAAYFCIPIGFLSLSIILILNIAMNILGIEHPKSGFGKA